MRFLVEVHNRTGAAIDTPTLGIVIPHLPSESNFGWATPFQGVTHSNSSSGLVGVAPAGITSDDFWETPDWILCRDIRTEKSEYVGRWGVKFEQEFAVRDPGNFLIDLEITNTGDDLPSDLTLSGLVRDAQGRIAGGTVSIYLNTIKSGETKSLSVPITPQLQYAANPLPVIAHSTDISVDFSLQPFKPYDYAPGCPTMMPWNR